MLILCHGMPKSGCTPVFELVRSMLLHAGEPQETFINEERREDRVSPLMRNFARNLTREKIERMLSAIGPGRKVLVKTHSRMPEGQFRWLENLYDAGELRVLASYRDPRAMCLSVLASAAKRNKATTGVIDTVELRHAITSVQRRIPHFREWGALKGTLRINYDTAVLLLDDAMDHIEAALGIKTNRAAAKRDTLETSHVSKVRDRRERFDEFSDAQNTELVERFGEFLSQVCALDNQAWFDARRPSLLKASDERVTEPLGE
ncbi:MAG TPA: hypothetical protein VHE09_17030 [Rhizomicrobium sp.]|nr:hypothetical protein [Rhizomicrobium sp.]